MSFGHYEKAVLAGIKREGSMPSTIRKGYSRQVKSLLRKGAIKEKNGRLTLNK
jgi:hypothetical protein